MDRNERDALDRHITGNGGEDQLRDDREELLQVDAMMAVYNAINDGWNETEEWTIEQMPGTTDTYEIDLPATHQTIRYETDLPATHQTIRITVDIRPST